MFVSISYINCAFLFADDNDTSIHLFNMKNGHRSFSSILLPSNRIPVIIVCLKYRVNARPLSLMKNAIKKLSRLSNKTEKNIYKNYLNNILMKRFAKPSEIADTCFYFANSKFVTGTFALVDGGENA